MGLCLPSRLAGRALVECVPNFSEGKDASKVEAIARAISACGSAVLRAESDVDHNRSVITFAGSPDAVAESAFEGIAAAARLIDLQRHRGVHPRIGAADVVPFVPLAGVTLEDCIALARRVGERVWAELRVPVYFYESAALRSSCVPLENVRRGQFEKPEQAPDLGGPGLHPSAGASIIGARKLLVAFNVNLNTPDVQVARAIARRVRASGGGLPNVKALGVMLESRRLAQIPMNLTDYKVTAPAAAFDAVDREARREGVEILSTQMVGLVPREAVDRAHPAFTLCEDFGEHRILESCLERAFP